MAIGKKRVWRSISDRGSAQPELCRIACPLIDGKAHLVAARLDQLAVVGDGLAAPIHLAAEIPVLPAPGAGGQAQRLALQSKLSADLALARAELLKAQAVNQDMQQSIDALQQEAQRNLSGVKP